MLPILVLLAALPAALAQPKTPQNPPVFAQRGCYLTFMRMPTYGLAEWKRILDAIREDGGDTVILWMAGGFRSRKFPLTWRYNAAHQNIRRDFVRRLIDYAHAKEMKILLGFTPFGYDGVNQMPQEHPEWKATGADGKPTARFGIHCWGYNLCPSQAGAQAFMREYVREMTQDFYPNADGLMIESSDYAICHCQDCKGAFFAKEFACVVAISQEMWAKKPDATILVYPHYFSNRRIEFAQTQGAGLPFDPRWSLFFTPHSAALDADLIGKAKTSLWWDDSPALRTPQEIRAGAQRAKQAGVTGYLPSYEAYSYLTTEPEDGQGWLVGKRQAPMGFGWLKEREIPYGELPMRANRIAYREFTRDPDLDFRAYVETLRRELFGAKGTLQMAEDLLFLQRLLQTDRSWSLSAPLAQPERVLAMSQAGALSAEKRAAYRAALEQVKTIAARYAKGRDGAGSLRRIADWILLQWSGENANLLKER